MLFTVAVILHPVAAGDDQFIYSRWLAAPPAGLGRHRSDSTADQSASGSPWFRLIPPNDDPPVLEVRTSSTSF
jgi:hypothetical protein